MRHASTPNQTAFSSAVILTTALFLTFTGPDSRHKLLAQDRGSSAQFIRGDSNTDGVLDLSDAVHTLGYLFLGGPKSTCLAAADANDDEIVNLSDPTATLSAIFMGGRRLPAPGEQAGLDPTPGIGCADGIQEHLEPHETYPGYEHSEHSPDIVPIHAAAASGATPLLVICWDPHRPDHAAPPIADVERLIFGGYPSVSDYFLANSSGQFTVSKAALFGWYPADKNWEHYWDHPEDSGDEWVRGHWEKWTEAIRKADGAFDYSSYDSNNDGVLATSELGILIVIPQNRPFGTNRVPLSRELPSAQPLIVDGVRIPMIAEAYIGSPMNLPVVAHELAHLYLHLPDMYAPPGLPFVPYRAGDFSLMDVSYRDAHIDPYHKIELGWVDPQIVTQSGIYSFPAVEQSNKVYILRDDSRDENEYFILENRQRNVAYDSNLPDTGLAVWHIIEDKDVYENLPAPVGVASEDWEKLRGFGRRGIRLVRPVYGPPVFISRSLWDGSDPVTGYDLLSEDPNPEHTTLRWADGSPSGFSIRDISPSADTMTARVEVPWGATAWIHNSTGSGFEYRSSYDRFAGFWDEQRWLAGDFDGDGRDDLVNVYSRQGDTRAWVHLSNGAGVEFQSSINTLARFSTTQRWIAGDFNGDGRDDLVNVYGSSTGDTRAWVHLSTGAGFEFQSSFDTLARFSTAQRWIAGDFNGDGRDDLVNVYGNNGDTRAWVHLSTGAGFEFQSSFTTLAGFWDEQRWIAGDFNGDGLDDLVNVYGHNGDTRAWVHLSTGAGFEFQSSINTLARFSTAQRWIAGDFNGDGVDDLVNVYGNNGNARAWVHTSTGVGFEFQSSFDTLAGFWSEQRWIAGDFSGDGRDDLANVYGR